MYYITLHYITDSNICFPSLLTDKEMTEQVNDRATLVLASVAKKVKHSHSKWASSVIQRLENRLGVHGIYSHTLFLHSITDKYICGLFRQINKTVNSVES